MSTHSADAYIEESSIPMSPMSWYSGSQLTDTSSGPVSRPALLRMASMFAARFAWERTTPLGTAVDPDVNWTSATPSCGTATGEASAGPESRIVQNEHTRRARNALDVEKRCHVGRRHDRGCARCFENVLRLARERRGVSGLRRRRERHRHEPSARDAEECAEEHADLRADQRDALTRHEPLRAQRAGDGAGVGKQRRIGQPFGPAVVFDDADAALAAGGCAERAGNREAGSHDVGASASDARRLTSAAI